MRPKPSFRPSLLVAGLLLATGLVRAQPQPEAEPTVQPAVVPKREFTLGVQVDFSSLTSKGVRINGVTLGSHAAKLGLEPGDYITEVDGYPVGLLNGRAYTLESEFRRARGAIKLKVWDQRSGKILDFRVDRGSRKDAGPDSSADGLPPDESKGLPRGAKY